METDIQMFIESELIAKSSTVDPLFLKPQYYDHQDFFDSVRWLFENYETRIYAWVKIVKNGLSILEKKTYIVKGPISEKHATEICLHVIGLSGHPDKIEIVHMMTIIHMPPFDETHYSALIGEFEDEAKKLLDQNKELSPVTV